MSLSRLGRLDLVLDRAESLPSEVVVSAVVAPPRDCHPLADFIERRPAYLPALGQYFAPCNGFCDI
ncbi:hypothetical protein [Amycolatopsis sp. NBC_01286]|uniref:hypothetical protein n=1 Tax=Amycolatopsis sp. NBC_01286 TaxID=2903560 RepID=UPI002E14E2A4|nr:hypothetical protein OG570_29170 [Amycolatopsis sp. NBC_01286]